MTQHLLIINKPRQRGITLIEVLISVFIVSFAVVGAAALQVNSLKNSMAMEYRAQASFLANDMFERMRAVRGSDLSVYRIQTIAPLLVEDPPLDDGAPPPPPSTLAQNNLKEWAGLVHGTLPSGDVSIGVDVNTVILTFSWQQNSPYAQGGAANEQITFVIEAVI